MLKKIFLVCVLFPLCVHADIASTSYVDTSFDRVASRIPDSYTKLEMDNRLASKADVSVSDTIATTRPSGTPATGRAFIWVSEN
ncbi:MAG: hypothetical protein ACLRFJ_03895 [Alphaproteobacteria bacterium]